jgi:purine-nucleoside phosphorylase
MLKNELLAETLEHLRAKGFETPEIGIVLGTGLGQLVDQLEIIAVAHYHHIPHFPVSTVEYHSGKLLYGILGDKKVVVMQGRFHLYEGYDFVSLTYPIRVMHALGIKKLLISNAAGAINTGFKKGELMLIDDHINLQGGSPLVFSNVSEYGPRFVDMICPYDSTLSFLALKIAKELEITLRKGVYAAVVGPQLETRAEYRMLKIIGADAVGMSTVPEVIVANQLELPVIAISVLTDECDPDHLEPINVEEILAIAKEAEPRLITLIKELINRS